MLRDDCGSGTSGPNLPWSNGQPELGLLMVPSWIPLALMWVPPEAEPEIKTQKVTPESRSEGRYSGTGKRKGCGGLASSWH